MSKVRWLHISDMHYGHESYVTKEMRSNMLRSLPNILTGDAQPEYLFITGDLRYGKNHENEFPNEIENDIKRLMKAFNILPEHVHIAMGNHDVMREFGRADIAPLLRKEYAKNGNLNDDRMKSLEQSQHKFYEIYKSICNREPVSYHELFPETNFNVIHLNTAFACSDDGEDGDLIVGMPLVQKAFENIDASKPGIVLAHHGFESLQPKERELLEIKLKENGVLLYLCGHEHLADRRNIAVRRENKHLFEYICGTGMDKLPTGQPAEMVVFMGELDTEQKNGYIRALEWRDRSGAWLPYSDISYKQTGLPDGYNYFPSPPVYNIIKESLKKEAINKYLKYLLYECGEIRLDGMPADDKVGSKTLELEKLFIPIKFDRKDIIDRKDTSFDTMILSFELLEAQRNEKLFQYIDNLIKQIENGNWNQYNESDLLEIDELIRKLDSSSNDQSTQEKICLLKSQIELLHENDSLIPSKQSGFHRVILAGPGGGKTTLLKRLVMAYAFQERRDDPEIDDKLPDRELLPIWIRCRDLKEKASLSINEIIQNIPLIAEFPPDKELTSAFIAEVFERIEKGKTLLLIDGLDEISDTGLRKNFAEKIARFAQLNPKMNVIVTSRIAGFKYVSDGKLGSFPQLLISKLEDKDIRLLCRKWHKVIYGDKKEVICQADVLADTILSHEKIRALAGSPLLLTTLLLVQRRVGRLPTKRATLYEESVKVLLETWNQEAYESLDMDIALCQLSYVAFEMMLKGIQTIERQELELLLKNVR
ncbi:MAG: metallophosphoesterase, partial [Clostridiales bacterium]|nr:metallophosphoesterase [Clostridiales bacterium]